MAAKKKSSVWRTAGLTALLLVACAALSVATINLVVIPFLNSATQPKAQTGTVPQVAQATATVDFEEGPPPPGTPTGELPTPLPTLSKDQLHNAPTAEYPPDVPTLEPIPDIDAVAPTFAPIIGLPPSDEWITYTNKEFGFSFEYPSNWIIEATVKSKNSVIPGYGLIVRNYEDLPTKEDKTIEQLKIDIGAGRTLPDSIPDLTAWAVQHLDSKVIGSESIFSATPIENLVIDGVPAVRWTQTAEMIPQGNVIVGLVKDNKLYVFSAYPATSKYISTFDRIVSSFQVP
jgi:hypothetical protein